MIQITFPDKTSIKDLKDNRYKVVIEPFFPGFGVTVGNSLRRVLLSSLEGSAVTSFKVEGAQHEFDSVDGVKEDLVEIMLNLKQLRVKSFSEEPVKLSIDVKGEKAVTAADIKKNADVEIMNPDLVIATITEKATKFSMEIIVEQGRGYVTVEQRDETEKLEIGTVAIDSSFSPVLNVGYKIDNVRVGEMTNYESLTLDIVTDGSIDAKEAISRAAKILEDHFTLFIQEEKEDKPKKATKKKATKEDKEENDKDKEDKEDK
ncbi:MAG: DNA-directed RNA polymerase subunit alpha [Candidatus Pacebacteria bacterium]|jgi:DNA-directed RNA polymerase subunit alpha|nr:DNA-directed RNA polymerase subunit alpha [Candidatus Komeilibacteria bacterium]MBT6921001.1 DNA-directed RNA polymerase subunit alpha [Candidatus Paceibacterota bacterium]